MHRDIKPANFLIDDNCQVKLCDFGVSRPVIRNIDVKIRQSVNENNEARVSKKLNLQPPKVP